jgi:hypothetical protein
MKFRSAGEGGAEVEEGKARRFGVGEGEGAESREGEESEKQRP